MDIHNRVEARQKTSLSEKELSRRQTRRCDPEPGRLTACSCIYLPHINVPLVEEQHGLARLCIAWLPGFSELNIGETVRNSFTCDTAQSFEGIRQLSEERHTLSLYRAIDFRIRSSGDGLISLRQTEGARGQNPNETCVHLGNIEALKKAHRPSLFCTVAPLVEGALQQRNTTRLCYRCNDPTPMQTRSTRPCTSRSMVRHLIKRTYVCS